MCRDTSKPITTPALEDRSCRLHPKKNAPIDLSLAAKVNRGEGLEQMDSTKPTAPPPTPFITVQLIGGAHDGQQMRVPIDQARVELVRDGRQHVYMRFNDAPVLRHVDVLKQMGGGR